MLVLIKIFKIFINKVKVKQFNGYYFGKQRFNFTHKNIP